MNVYYEAFNHDIEDMIHFMTSDTWTYHATQNADPERIRAAYDNNYYDNEGCKTFWIKSDINNIVGFVRIYDLDDGTPLFDVRISSAYKGKGLGVKTVKWMVDYIFETYSDIDRIEGNTRQDNFAMRCVFNKCGFVKESHYRKAWTCRNGEVYDAIGYGITREDWNNNEITPLNWQDFKC